MKCLIAEKAIRPALAECASWEITCVSHHQGNCIPKSRVSGRNVSLCSRCIKRKPEQPGHRLFSEAGANWRASSLRDCELGQQTWSIPETCEHCCGSWPSSFCRLDTCNHALLVMLNSLKAPCAQRDLYFHLSLDQQLDPAHSRSRR